MNTIIVGFSTTGKSTILKGLKGIVPDNVQLLDSDFVISKGYNNRIYNLFLQNHIIEDPVSRKNIMNKIDFEENKFIQLLNDSPEPYIAALGPNVHIRSNWKNYYFSTKPFVVFLKCNIETVYDGLKSREEKIDSKLAHNPAFGNWNHGVIRKYSYETKKYEMLPKEEALINISKLVKVNEDVYSQISDYTIDATKLFEWHDDFDLNEKDKLIELLKKNVS